MTTCLTCREFRAFTVLRKSTDWTCSHDRFPPSWPVYTPAHKLAGWLEYYAEAMELNVWTSTTVTKAEQDANDEWNVTVEKKDGSTRVFHVKHLVFSIGLGGNNPNFPKFPGQEEYQGEILHSIHHNSAKDHVGKKVLIVGACTSGKSAPTSCGATGAHYPISTRYRGGLRGPRRR